MERFHFRTYPRTLGGFLERKGQPNLTRHQQTHLRSRAESLVVWTTTSPQLHFRRRLRRQAPNLGARATRVSWEHPSVVQRCLRKQATTPVADMRTTSSECCRCQKCRRKRAHCPVGEASASCCRELHLRKRLRKRATFVGAYVSVISSATRSQTYPQNRAMQSQRHPRSREVILDGRHQGAVYRQMHPQNWAGSLRWWSGSFPPLVSARGVYRREHDRFQSDRDYRK